MDKENNILIINTPNSINNSKQNISQLLNTSIEFDENLTNKLSHIARIFLESEKTAGNKLSHIAKTIRESEKIAEKSLSHIAKMIRESEKAAGKSLSHIAKMIRESEKAAGKSLSHIAKMIRESEVVAGKNINNIKKTISNNSNIITESLKTLESFKQLQQTVNINFFELPETLKKTSIIPKNPKQLSSFHENFFKIASEIDNAINLENVKIEEIKKENNSFLLKVFLDYIKRLPKRLLTPDFIFTTLFTIKSWGLANEGIKQFDKFIDLYKKDQNEIKKELHKLTKSLETQNHTYYIVNNKNPVNIYDKPKRKNKVLIKKLYRFQEVRLIEMKRKWVKIEYINITHDRVETGWCYKKYLKLKLIKFPKN